MTSLEYIVTTLQHVQHTNGDIRRPAEEELNKFLQNISDSVPILLSLASSSSSSVLLEQPIHIKQLALLIINQLIKNRFDEFNQELKGSLVNFTVQIILNPIYIHTYQSLPQAIIIASISILSRIAAYGKQNEYVKVVQYIETLISSPSTSSISQAYLMKCYLEICQDVDDDRKLFLFSILSQKFSIIFNLSNRNNKKLLRYTSKIMTILCNTLLNIRISGGYDETDQSYQYIGYNINLWVTTVIAWISQSHSLEYTIRSELDILVEILQSLPLAIESHPDECSNLFIPILKSSWLILQHIRYIYMCQYVTIGRIGENIYGIEEDGYTSDGDRYDISILTKNLMDLMNISIISLHPTDSMLITIFEPVLSHPTLSVISIQSMDSVAFSHRKGLDRFVSVIIDMCLLSDASQKQFMDETNVFVSMEEENSSDQSLRHVAADLVRSIATNRILTIQSFLIQYLTMVYNTIQTEYSSLRSSSTESNHRNVVLERLCIQMLELEACLWLFGSISKIYIKSLIVYYSNNSSKTKLSNQPHRGGDIDNSSNNNSNNSMEDITMIPNTIESIITSLITLHNNMLSYSVHENQNNPIINNSIGKCSYMILSRALWVFGRYKYVYSISSQALMISQCLITLQNHNNNSNNNSNTVLSSLNQSIINYPATTKLLAIRTIGEIIRPSKKSILLDSNNSILSFEDNNNGNSSGNESSDDKYDNNNKIIERKKIAKDRLVSILSMIRFSDILMGSISLLSLCDENTLYYPLETIDMVFMLTIKCYRILYQSDSMSTIVLTSSNSSLLIIDENTIGYTIDNCLNLWSRYKSDPMLLDLIDSILSHVRRTHGAYLILLQKYISFYNHLLSYLVGQNDVVGQNRSIYIPLWDICYTQLLSIISDSIPNIDSTRDHSEPYSESYTESYRNQILLSMKDILWHSIESIHILIVSNQLQTMLSKQSDISISRDINLVINSILSLLHIPNYRIFMNTILPMEIRYEFISKALEYIVVVFELIRIGSKKDDLSVELIQSVGPTIGLMTHCILLMDESYATYTNNISQISNNSTNNSNNDSSSNLYGHLIESYCNIIEISILIMKITSSEYIRLSILMGFIHIISHRLDILSKCLYHIQFYRIMMNSNDDDSNNKKKDDNSSNTQNNLERPNILSDLLTLWYNTHGTFRTLYCNRISSIGLCRLILFFHQSNSITNQNIAKSTTQILLQSLPRLLQSESESRTKFQSELHGRVENRNLIQVFDGYDNDEDEEMDNDDQEDDEIWSEEDDDEDEEMEEEEDEEMEEEEDEEMVGYDEDENDNNYDKPNNHRLFAPAEKYLSDMISSNSNTIPITIKRRGGDDIEDGIGMNGIQSVMNNISDSLVFNPSKYDPNYSTSLQDEVIECFVSLCAKTETG